MARYWFLSYPRQNVETSIANKLIGGRTTKAYERLFKDKLSKGDKLVLAITREGKIRGFCYIGDYKYDTTPVWEVVHGETYPYRRSIEPIKLYSLGEEPLISSFYEDLDLLSESRKRRVNLGMAFGMIKRGLTPKEISEHDFNLLFSGQSQTASISPKPTGSFAFVDKDFASTTGKKNDARYLNDRFKTLYDVVKKNLSGDLAEFTNSYVSRIFNQGSKKYRKYIWLGFVHNKLPGKPQKSVQLQVGINPNDPFAIEIFMHSLAREIRRKTKSNIIANKSAFLRYLNSLDNYILGYETEEPVEYQAKNATENNLTDFIDNMDRADTHVYLTRRMTEKEVVNRGESIVGEIINTWQQMLPIYNINAFGKAEAEQLYFILRTGGGGYSDEPEKKYNFREGIPGSKQLLNAENNGKFVYLENGNFYGMGKIGEITSYKENGKKFFNAQIIDYEKIVPFSFSSLKDKVSFDSVGQAGIRKISKEDYEIIVGAQEKGELDLIFADLDLLLEDLAFDDLLFENEQEMKSQIYAALISGKHIMLIGPPGTGKTEVARKIGGIVSEKNYVDSFVLTTATSDWTTFDTIGGYAPAKDGKSLEFLPGQFLRCFKENEVQCNKWLIIDEINRADID